VIVLIKGVAKKGKITKLLVKTLKPGDIPIIFHSDLDATAANSLVEAKVKAVINCKPCISGTYPANGAKILIQHGIQVLDNMGDQFYDKLKDGDRIEIKNNQLFINGILYTGKVQFLDNESLQTLMKKSYDNFHVELNRFIENTLRYAEKEKDIILKKANLPELRTKMENRHVLIVARGYKHKQDLMMIREYIKDFKPVLIGVDGGGDALLEYGMVPDIIIGDMDSVSDVCLKKSKEIVVHAYPNGFAPGLERIKKLGLEAKLFAFPGTSEDVAMIMAYEKKADLIVTVGTHSNIIDFLEKGRKGMASTMLTRLKIGDKIVDASGVSRLYSNKLRLFYCIPVILSALIPILAILRIYIPFELLIYILQLKLQR